MRKIILYILSILFTYTYGAQAQTAVVPDPVFRQFLVNNYAAVMNGSQEIIIANAASITGTFTCINQNVTNLSGIEYFTGIQRLYVSDNQISFIPDLTPLTNLEELRCFNNVLTTLPTLGTKPSFTLLHCYNNRITSLPDLSGLPALQQLLCNTNQLTQLPDLTNNTQLVNLFCYENKLSSLPSLTTNTSLESLLCYSNTISALPSLTTLLQLKDLECSRNKLTAIPSLANNTSLQIFKCFDNNLTELPTSVSGLTQLTELWCYGNQFTALPNLSALVNLQILSCFKNKLSSIRGIENLTSLTTLNFGDNQFTEFPNIQSLSNLQTISCYINKLTSIPNLSGITSLTMLDINHNQLSFEDFLPLKNLPNFNNFILMPQDSILLQGATVYNEKETLVLEAPVDINSTSNQYRWYAGNRLVAEGSDRVLTIPNIKPADEASYKCEITNTNFAPSVKLYSYPKKISVRACSSRDCDDYVLSPNGDGKADEYTFEESGIAKIIDRSGTVVQELQLPTVWDVTDRQGKILPLGLYLIKINDEKTIKITVVH